MKICFDTQNMLDVSSQLFEPYSVAKIKGLMLKFYVLYQKFLAFLKKYYKLVNIPLKMRLPYAGIFFFYFTKFNVALLLLIVSM